jgi:VanZ family protein
VKLIKNLLAHKRIIQLLTAIWTALVAYLCLASAESLPEVNVFRFDKMGHFGFHFGITTLWFLFWKTTFKNENKYALIKAFLFSFFFGVVIEVSQGLFTTTRQSDIYDIYANSMGGLTAVLLLFILGKISFKKSII